jgi:probable DNA metabolism protein
MEPAESHTLIYEDGFEGLLSAIFECYRLKLNPTGFYPQSTYQPGILDVPLHVSTSAEHVQRIKKGLDSILPGTPALLFRVFLSEQPDIEMLIYRYVRLLTERGATACTDYREETVLRIQKTDRQIGREVHRMHAFVRFQETREHIFFAAIHPDFNVIPLIGEYFEKRYADQKWTVYDVKRNYGIHYNLQTVTFVTLDVSTDRLHRISAELLSENETGYQQLWKEQRATNQ